MIERELDRFLPFLATTKMLMAAVRSGVGREAAHEAIKENAVAVALDLRAGQSGNDLFERLAADDRLGLTAEQIEDLASAPLEFTGAARAQVAAVAQAVADVAARYPQAAAYSPAPIL